MPFVLTFETGATVTGSVQWTKGGLSGMRFSTPVSSDLVLMRARPAHQRAHRYRVARAASIAFREGVRRCMIRNVSDGGMLIEAIGTLKPGQVVEISSGKFSATGQVRWSNGNYSGLKLTQPLCLDDFENATVSSATRPGAVEVGHHV